MPSRPIDGAAIKGLTKPVRNRYDPKDTRQFDAGDNDAMPMFNPDPATEPGRVYTDAIRVAKARAKRGNVL